MYSATGLVAIFAALALAVNVITDSADQKPPAAGAATLGVAADGSGDFSTIADAVTAAADGDTILVGPGTYQEAMLIDKDVIIRGDGPRESIVITGYADPAMWPTDGERECDYGSQGLDGCSALIVDSDAVISDLTFHGNVGGVWVYGGSPLFERVIFDVVGRPWSALEEGGGESLVASDEAELVLRDSLLRDSRAPWLRRGSDALVEDNAFTEGTGLIVADTGPDAVIRGNHFTGAGGISVFDVTTALIEDNVIEGAHGYAIEINDGDGTAAGFDPVVRGNVIENSEDGILIVSLAKPSIEGNSISGVGTGIQIAGSEAAISGNEVTDATTGIVVVSGGAPSITDNVIDVTGRGIVAGRGTSPLIEGNDVCGGEMSIFVNDEATPELGQNQTCEGSAA